MPANRLVCEQGAHHYRNQWVHVRVTRNFGRRNVVQEPHVCGVADQRAEHDQVGQCAQRFVREAGHDRLPFADQQRHRQQNAAAGEQLHRRSAHRIATGVLARTHGAHRPGRTRAYQGERWQQGNARRGIPTDQHAHAGNSRDQGAYE